MPIKGEKSKHYKIESYTFQGFDDFNQGCEEYDFKDLSTLDPEAFTNSQKPQPEIIRQERTHAKQTNFQINPKVKELRGIREQEDQDYEQKVSTEIESRLSVLKVQAEEEGLKKGIESGQQQAYEDAKKMYEQKIEELSAVIDEVKHAREELYQSEKEDAYKLIKSLAKWVLLKEIDEDDKYLSRLLEKLILELNQKKNLLVRVSAENFGKMDGIIEMLESKLGALTNVRVEIDQDLQDTGIILESENGIVDGSMKAQFENFERIFESVGLAKDEA